MSLSNLHSSIQSCKKCQLSKKCIPLPGFQLENPQPKIGIILCNPSKEATEQSSAWEGVIGDYIQKLCNKAEIAQRDIFISYLARCSTWNASDPPFTILNTCSPWLDKQIELSEPKVLIGCGKEVIRHLLNIPKKTIPLKDYIGNEYPYGNFYTKVIPAYSIQYCLRRGWPTEQEFLGIFRKAKEIGG